MERNEHPRVNSSDVSRRFCLKCHKLCPKMSLSLSGLQRALWVTSLDELSSYLKLDDLNPSNYVCAAL